MFCDQSNTAVICAQECWCLHVTHPSSALNGDMESLDDAKERDLQSKAFTTTLNSIPDGSAPHLPHAFPPCSTLLQHKPALLHHIAPSSGHLAQMCFLTDYIISSSMTSPLQGFLGQLPHLYRESGSESCLSTAMSAAALANLARRLSLSDLCTNAATEYG